MKTIFFIITVLFSFASVNAQDIAVQESNINTNIVKSSKTDFYKALVKANNFDIAIKEDKKEVATTKEDFYNLLMEKNGFQTNPRKTTRFANVEVKNENSTNNTQKQAIVSLLP